MQLLTPSDLRKCEQIQMRAKLDESYIDELASAIRSNHKEIPPIHVVKVDKTLVVVDGCHRRAAAIRAKRGVNAIVKRGPEDWAREMAVKSNHAHGLRRSAADKRHCVTQALSWWPDLSSRVIAERCGVSHTFVEQQRKTPTKQGTKNPSGNVARRAPRQRVGKDGRKISPKKDAATEFDPQNLPPGPPKKKQGSIVSKKEANAALGKLVRELSKLDMRDQFEKCLTQIAEALKSEHRRVK